MTSTHIEHPEDLILTGDMSVIDALFAPADITMKMDGMSLVWGTNPDNGKFFVCTKAHSTRKRFVFVIPQTTSSLTLVIK